MQKEVRESPEKYSFEAVTVKKLFIEWESTQTCMCCKCSLLYLLGNHGLCENQGIVVRLLRSYLLGIALKLTAIILRKREYFYDFLWLVRM